MKDSEKYVDIFFSYNDFESDLIKEMLTREEIKDQPGWGHSSWEQAVAVAQEAGVKKLALFHHDPRHTDRFLFEVEKQCQERFPEAFLAREGMMLHL